MNELTERAVQKIEKAYIQKTLKQAKGHLGETAKKAGITRRTLYTKMKQYGLDVTDFRTT
jgi:DNA-binding NtrC family response regulator